MMKKEKQSFGRLRDKREATLYTLSRKDFTVRISDYGATVVSLIIKNPSTGEYTDVVLGFDSAEQYESDSSCFGGVCGRFANRIKNACFSLNGKEYKLAANNNGNHLHGGIEGFHKKLWKAEFTQNGISLVYISPDAEEGYPGKLQARVTYTITQNNALIIEYSAFSDKDTIVNFTNHSYFNLCGHDSGNILNQSLQLNATEYTPIDTTSCPTGEILSVKNTPFDFTSFHKLSERINSSHPQMIIGNGYDHNFVINQTGDCDYIQKLPLAATAFSPSNSLGLRLFMKVYTDKPGVQLYTGNFISEKTKGKSGALYGPRHGFCLETQYFPDSINHSNFPSPVLKSDQKYRFKTIYQFSYVNH